MDRRFPFDQTGGGRQPQVSLFVITNINVLASLMILRYLHSPRLMSQMNPAQLRAALGLPPAAEDSFYLQQQHAAAQHHAAAQQQQHDLHIRRLIQEQQLRSRGEPIHDYPDLQHRLNRSLLINEQIAAQQLGGNPAQLQLQQHQQQQQQHQAAFLREQAKMHLHAEEKLLLMRQQQQKQQQKQHFETAFHADSSSQGAQSKLDSNQSLAQKKTTLSPVRVETPTYASHRSTEKDTISRTSSGVRDESVLLVQSENQRDQHEQQIHNQREEQVKAFLASYNGQNNQSILKQAFDQKQQSQQQKVTQQDLLLSFSRGNDDSPFPQYGSKPSDYPPSSLPLTNTAMKRPNIPIETKGVIEMEISRQFSPNVPSFKKEKKRRRTKAEMRGEISQPICSMPEKKTKLSPRSHSMEINLLIPELPLLSNDTPLISGKDTRIDTTGFRPINDRDTVQSPDPNFSTESDLKFNGVGGGANMVQEQKDSSNTFSANENEPDVDDESIQQKGTFADLLDVAGEVSLLDDAAHILLATVGMAELMSDSEAEYDDDRDYGPPQMPYGLPVPQDLKTELVLPLGSPTPTFTFISRTPQLPEEPIFAQDVNGERGNIRGQVDHVGGLQKKTTDDSANGTSKKDKKLPAILEYPYPIDTWWPSVSGMRKERRNAGESSDEDNFEESPYPYGILTSFRANEPKIRSRLSSELEPGVLEKLPHCMIHRVRTKRKKNSTAPELVYCWQVSEIYPNDIMVSCSRCGTWRHAACGGHYKPYSTRENAIKPFVPICDNCAEEERFLREYPVGARRLERQRMEHLRRALSTSAVMRHASFSKHGGTYKWPLGSVTDTHISGHIRSVHARHDKAEKQWTDMANRLGRGGYGYRQKERVRSRTKEFERLLVSIEDAEGYTDRHNMILFLQRDTAKDKPAGLENEVRNIFDPDEDEISVEDGEEADFENVIDLVNQLESNNKKKNDDDEILENNIDETTKQLVFEEQQDDDNVLTTNGNRCGPCSRFQCNKRRRFDSQFCSDACGVITLEEDLLRIIHDANEIHPSVLRL